MLYPARKINIYEGNEIYSEHFKNKLKLSYNCWRFLIGIADDATYPWPEGMCEPHYGNQDFSPLITLIIKKTPLSNGNSPNNTDPITEMGLEHAFEPNYNNIKWFFQGPVNRGGKDNSYEIVSELTSNDVEEEVYSSLNDDPPSMKSKRHKIDITECSSKCLCPYLRPKPWGSAYFDPKKYTLKIFVFTFIIIIV